MSTERPILFSGAMVRALLAGTKTQTRRAVKSVELARGEAMGVRVAPGTFCYIDFDGVPGLSWRPFGGSPTVPYPPEKVAAACPYGAPGDRLWVRETWAKAGEVGDSVEYRADNGDPTNGRWRPSIHMPRRVSRLTLEVTDVRVERLQDISESDSQAEGVEATTLPEEWHAVRLMHGHNEAIAFPSLPSDATISDLGLRSLCHVPPRVLISARDQYARLWEDINGADSWAKNPWVWVIEFRKAKP